MNVGFIGIGHLGELMAWNILEAGYELAVHDLRKDAARYFWRKEPDGQTAQKPWP